MIQEILSKPELVPSLMEGVSHSDPAVAAACADAAEKIGLAAPQLLSPYKKRFLQLAAESTGAGPRWHLAQILPRLPLNSRERGAASEILFEYLEDTHSLVKTFAMQGLADLAARDDRLRATVLPVIEHLTANGSAAVRARGRKLLKALRVT